MNTETIKTSGKLVEAALELIVFSATNPRKNFKTPDWPEFVESVRTHGVIQPGVARPGVKGSYELVAGERRCRAAMECKLATMPLVVRDLTDAEVIELQQIENLQREDLSALEEAQGYADWREALLKSGTCKTVDEAVNYIAGKISRKKTMVYDRLALLKAAPAVQQAVSEGKLDASKAQLIAKVPDPKAQADLLNEAANNDAGDELSFRQLKDVIEERYQVSLKGAPFLLTTTFTTAQQDGKPAPACLNCAYRSENLCRNPACFRSKCQAVATQEPSRIAGVWTEKEFREREYSNDWVEVESKCYDDASNRTWEQLLGKFAPPVWVAIGTGHRTGRGNGLMMMRYWKRSEVAKIAKDNKLLKAAAPAKPSKAQLKYEREREEKKVKAEAAAKEMVVTTAKISSAAAPDLYRANPVAWLRRVIETILIGVYEYDTLEKEALTGRNLPFDEEDDDKNRETLLKHVRQEQADGNLVGLLVELLVERAGDRIGYHSSEDCTRMKAQALWVAPSAKVKPAAAVKEKKVKPAKTAKATKVTKVKAKGKKTK